MTESSEAPLRTNGRDAFVSVRFLDRLISGSMAVFLATSFFSIALSQAPAMLALVTWIALCVKTRRRPDLPLAWSFALFFLASAAAAVAAEDKAAALDELTTFWKVGLFYLVVDRYRGTDRLRTPLRLFLIFGGASALFGLTQTLRFGTEYRIHGTMGHYMTFSGLMVLLTLVAGGRLVYRARGHGDRLAIAVLAVGLAALLMTHTRCAWLGFLAGAGVLLWYRSRRLVLALPIVAVLLVLMAPRPVKDRIFSMVNVKDVTLVERTYMWRSGLDMAVEHPLTGVGPGNVERAYPDYKLPDDPWPPWRKFSHLHSNPIQIVAERGFPGLALWLSIWSAFFYRARRILLHDSGPRSDAAALIASSIAVVVGFLVAGIFEYNFGDSELIILVYFIMGLPFCLRSRPAEVPPPSAQEHGDVPSSRPRISAIVTTSNEENNVADCVASLLWCDEILVVDSFSTDRTPAIAQSYDSVRFLQRAYYGGASQKNWAMDQVRYEWILILDADERCSPELRQEIEALLSEGPAADAYAIKRQVFFLGKQIRFSGVQHDRVVRLLRRGAGRYENRRVHARLVTRGVAPPLRNPLQHYMVRSFDEYVERIRIYSHWGAAQYWRERRNSGLCQVLLRPSYRFLRTYVIQLGFLDGMRGLVFCLLQACGTYMKWGMLWSWHVNAARGHMPNLPTFDEDEGAWEDLEHLE